MSTKRHFTGWLLAGCVILGAAGVAVAEPRKFVIDSDHFSIGFLVEHVGYSRILGMFLQGEGEFVYDEASRELSSGTVVIESTSVFSNHEERDQHLRNSDFLHSQEHPEITFEAAELRAGEGDSGELTGDLTLLGKTRPVTLDITLNKAARYPFGHEEYVLGASARTTIKRSEWGMTYGLDGDLVGDDVELILEFEAIRQ